MRGNLLPNDLFVTNADIVMQSDDLAALCPTGYTLHHEQHHTVPHNPHSAGCFASFDIMTEHSRTNTGLDKLADILRGRFNVRDDRPSESVVLVLGAGASLESGMPTWEDPQVREKLIKAVGSREGFGSEETFVEEAWRQLAHQLPVTGKDEHVDLKKLLIEKARTDHLCGVASLLVRGREKLFDFLQERYGPVKTHRSPQPQLGYELIAHLMKHRFVDHVISLNFDEVLDAALDDELGQDGYRLILPGFSAMKLDTTLPHLFKLHGTISDTGSLRFTTTDTGVLSRRVIELLDEIIFPAELERRVWIVSLGYSWKDSDMLWWVARHYKEVAGLICVVSRDESANRVRNAFNTLTKQQAEAEGLAEAANPLDKVFSVATEKVVEDGRAATVDEVLWAVWYSTKRNAEDTDRVPSAARHLLISHLFQSRAPDKRNWPAVYERHEDASRLEAEALLTAGKTDGMVTVSSLSQDPRMIRHWTSLAGRGHSALDRLDFLKRSSSHDITEVYFYEGKKLDDYKEHFARRYGQTLSLSQQQVPDLQERFILVPRLRNGKIHRERKPYLGFVSHYLEAVFTNLSVEVDPGPDPRDVFLFRKPKALSTYKLLRDYTTDVLQGNDWTTLLMIAESGRWLEDFRDYLTRPERKVFLIEASDFHPDWQLLHRPVDLPSEVLIIGVPWWVHHRHLTLTIGSDHALCEGIFFRRRERTARITPVALSNEHDLRELLNMFFSHVAGFYEYPGLHGSIRSPAYDAQNFWPELKARGVDRLLDDAEDTHWREKLEYAWRRCSEELAFED